MKKKILVVDDEVEVRNYLKNMLEQKGYAVDLAEGGKKALSRLKEEDFNVVILDLIMPDLDGFEVLRSIRSSFASLPVIILTAYGSEGKLKEAICLGATNFISKETGITELINKIEGCISHSAEIEEEEIDILVVEDEPTVAEFYKDVLKGEGYIVKHASCGEDAITLFIKYNPRLILLDILLPGIDGIETLRQIRKIDDEIIVFLVSAHLDTVSEIDKYSLNVYGEISKPVSGNKLKDYVREALDRGRARRKNEI